MARLENDARTSSTRSIPPEYLGRHRQRSAAAAVGWAVLGGLLYAATMFVPRFSGPQPLTILANIALGVGIGFVFGLPGAMCILRAKRSNAPSALELLARDPRPPVLYFRSFPSDEVAAKTVFFTSYVTEEEQIAEALNDVGPTVAIGEPSDRLPPVGAARMYLEDERWREGVLHLLESARLVVLRIGNSPGFWWEVRSTIATKRPNQIVLLVPRAEALYDEFRLGIRGLIPTPLPKLTGWDVKSWLRGSLKAVIFFAEDWVPTIVDAQTLRLPFLRRSPRTPLVPVLKTALAPLRPSLGLPPRTAGINKAMLGVLGGCAVICILRADECLPATQSIGLTPDVRIVSEPLLERSTAASTAKSSIVDAPAGDRSEMMTVHVAGRAVNLVLPYGMCFFDEQETFDQSLLAEQRHRGGIRIQTLAGMAQCEELDAARASKLDRLDRYGFVKAQMGFVHDKPLDIPRERYVRETADPEAQMSATKEAAKKLKDVHGVSDSGDGLVDLGEVYRESDAVGFAMSVPMKQDDEDFVQIAAWSVTLVNGIPLTINLYRERRSEATLPEVVADLKRTTRKLLEANP